MSSQPRQPAPKFAHARAAGGISTNKIPVPPEYQEILEELKNIPRKEDNGAAFSECFRGRYLNQITNPYELVLNLMKYSHDVAHKTPWSLASSMLKELDFWLQSTEQGKAIRANFGSLVSPGLQEEAFVLATTHHGYFLERTVRLYGLDAGNQSRFLPSVRKFVSQGKFYFAIQCTRVLKLEDLFSVADGVLVPAMLCGQMKLAVEFLNQSPETVPRLIKTLNQAVAIQYHDWKAYLSRFNIPKEREVKYNVKDQLGKCLFRLVEQHNIPRQSVPNLEVWRTDFIDGQKKSVLIFLCGNKYRGALSEEQWTEAVEYVLNVSPPCVVKFFLLHLVTKRSDLLEASKWAVRLNLAFSYDCPQDVQVFIQRNPYFDVSFPSPSHWTPPEEYLSLPKEVSVNFVSREAEMQCLIQKLHSSAPDSLTGLDVEWIPWEFGYPARPKAILMQLAFQTEAFLIDLQDTTHTITSWSEFINVLFGPIGVKIGWDFQGDLTYLRSALPNTTIQIVEESRLLCLSTLIQNLRHQDKAFVVVEDMPKPKKKHKGKKHNDNAAAGGQSSSSQLDDSGIGQQNDSNCSMEKEGGEGEGNDVQDKPLQRMGLAAACEYFLGKSLDKSEQSTHWGRRPLRSAQMHYAALDAYSLLDLYVKVKEKAASLCLDFKDAETKAFITG